MLFRSCHGLLLSLLVFSLAVLWCNVSSMASEEAPGAEQHDAAADDAGGGAHGAQTGGGEHEGEAGPDLSHANATKALENAVNFKSDLAIYTLIVFVVLLAVLGKFAWGPIMDGLAKREQAIADTIDDATRSAEDAQKQLQAYQTQLASAADEVRDLLDKARRDAETQKQEIVTQAQETAKFEKDRAVKEITAAKNQALAELARESVDTAVGLAGKIIRRQLNAADHTQLIEESLRRFPSEN